MQYFFRNRLFDRITNRDQKNAIINEEIFHNRKKEIRTKLFSMPNNHCNSDLCYVNITYPLKNCY